MVEHWTFNPQVLGSNPGTLKKYKDIIFIRKMYFKIKLTSFNKNSLIASIKVFSLFLHKLNIGYIAQKRLKTTKKKFTILRSPHVNSKSGEHFKRSLHKVTIAVISLNSKVLNFFLKKLEKNLSSDVSITVKKVKSSNKSNNFFNKFLNPDKYVLQLPQILSYVKVWDVFGENTFLVKQFK